jgi:alpha-D-xyloside xylohydrolase
LLGVAREYWRRGIRLDVIVVDFFHWPKQGEYQFDPEYWPDPERMIAELEANGTKLMVSIWPTIDKTSTHFEEMRARGLLVRTHRGVAITMDFMGDTVFFDATNPQAREYIWQLVKANYYDKGVRIFWLDEAEPEYSVYDWDNYRYYAGTDLRVGNIYPRTYAQGFYEGMSALQGAGIVNLVRCAWAGSQKFGALVWSGDVDSSFESLRNQLAIGLNMGMAGIPWWTSDIGGFHGGVNSDPSFRECLVRWFQFAVFSPVLRMHGDREPHEKPLSDKGGGRCPCARRCIVRTHTAPHSCDRSVMISRRTKMPGRCDRHRPKEIILFFRKPAHLLCTAPNVRLWSKRAMKQMDRYLVRVTGAWNSLSYSKPWLSHSTSSFRYVSYY